MRKGNCSKISALFIMILMQTMIIGTVFAKGGRPIPPPPPTPPLPTLASPFSYIVTSSPGGYVPDQKTGGDGVIRVWGWDSGDATYENIWTARYANWGQAVAIGDVDNDGPREVVAATCTIAKKVGSKTYYNLFFHAFKEGIEGIWLSSPSITDDVACSSMQITVADVDGDSNNEVVMITYHWLVVYRYNVGSKQMEIMNRVNVGSTLMLTSVTVDQKEILLSANDVSTYKAYLMSFDGGLHQLSTVPVKLGSKVLHAGDLDGDGKTEICSYGWKQSGTTYQTYLYVWERTDSTIIESHLFDSNDFPWVHLDIGELDPDHLGLEIVLAISIPEPNQMMVYELSGDLTTKWSKILSGSDYSRITINNLNVANLGGDGNKIITSGEYGCDHSAYYLEVFDQENSEWQYINCASDVYGVWDQAVG